MGGGGHEVSSTQTTVKRVLLADKGQGMLSDPKAKRACFYDPQANVSGVVQTIKA